jgi:hypothetical protein
VRISRHESEYIHGWSSLHFDDKEEIVGESQERFSRRLGRRSLVFRILCLQSLISQLKTVKLKGVPDL